MNKLLLIILKKSEILSGVSCRLTKLTGKSEQMIHPKHLINSKPPIYLNNLKKTDIVLDLGCHAGEHSFKVLPFVKEVVGVDYDDRFLKLAIERQKKDRIKNINFQKVDLENKFPFKNNQFNVVIFLDVIEHLNNRTQSLKEIYRVLKKNGLLILAAPNKDTSWKKRLKSAKMFYYSDPDHKIEFSQKELSNLCEKNKLKIESIVPISYDTPFAPFIDLIGGLSLSIYKLLSDWKRDMALKYPSESSGFLAFARKV